MNQLFKDLRTYFILGMIGIVSWSFYLLIRYPVLSIKYMIILGLILAVIFVLLLLSQYKAKSNKIRRIGKLLIVLFCIMTTILNYFFSTTMVNLLRSDSLLETDHVSVIVKATSPYQYTQDLMGKTYAILSTQDELVDKTIDKIEKENVEKISPKGYSGILTLVNALYQGNIDCMIINESYRSMIEEIFPNFSDTTRVIYSKQFITKTVLPEDKVLTKESFNVYISGIDTYGAISTKSRSDVNMIVTVNPNTKKILLTSIPRDYYIPFQVLNGEKDKLTHSGLYGVNETMGNVASYFGIDIDFYVRVNFDSVIDIVNTLGGIEVNNPRAFGQFAAGNIQLNGEQALSFSRERYAFEEGDKERGRNQMRVITGIINKVLSPSILNKYNTLLNNVRDSFQTNITDQQLISLVQMQLDDMASWSIEQISVNGTGDTLYSPIYGADLYMMVPDDSSVQSAKNQIQQTTKS